MYILLLFCTLSGLACLALHISSGNSFPRPLTPQEETACLLAIREGDIQARNKLIEHNLRLVAHVIKKYYSSNEDQDDLISVGTIGLIKAASTFDYEKGSKFATYAARCIENEILMQFRGRKKSAQDVYMFDPVDTDKNGNALTLIDIVADEDCVCETIEQKLRCELLHELIRERLDERERDILLMRYGLDGTRPLAQREVAAYLHISRSYVSRIEKKALEKLKKAFDEGETKKTVAARRS